MHEQNTDSPGAAVPVAPMLICVAAGLALALTPALIWRVKTGVWVCLAQPEILYYLQIAGEAYYNHLGHISDPTIAGGVSFYPWLPFVPVVFVVHVFGLSLFSVALIWSIFAGAGVGAVLYLTFWRFLRQRWMAAGLTIFCMSDFGFCGRFVFLLQLRQLAIALVIHPVGRLITIPFAQWRAPDPSLDLPFLFFQILAVSNARERPRRLNLWISGAAFGLLFYVFFYLWTMVAVALVIALLLDPAGRKAYGWTLLIGSAIGIPDLVLSLHSRAAAINEGVARLALFVPAASKARDYDLAFPILTAVFFAFAGFWIWKTRRFELIYLLSLVIAGLVLGYSRMVTHVFFHEYHYIWLWWSIRLVLGLIVVAAIAERRISPRAWHGPAFAAFALLYLIGGIYLNAIDVTRTRWRNRQIQNFVSYRTQRMAPGVSPLVPRSVLAGSQEFCELAAVAENQRQLAGWILPLSVALDNSGWESRAALNAYLNGVKRADFARATSEEVKDDYWFAEQQQPQLMEDFMRKFDEVTRDPDKFIRALDVRYVALPADQSPPPYVASQFRILQPGPYWRIWQIQQP